MASHQLTVAAAAAASVLIVRRRLWTLYPRAAVTMGIPRQDPRQIPNRHPSAEPVTAETAELLHYERGGDEKKTFL